MSVETAPSISFKLAAAKYHDNAPTLEKSEQSTQVFDFWFYASLGACDLGKIDNETVPDLRQYPQIRDAIQALPGSLAEDHLAKFANNLFTRMSPIKPEIKFRYLRGGFVIVEDHPRAWEARNLFEYYQDLVSEIQLSVEIDGTDVVGHEQPFGVYVNLLHTTEIERESGGFGKYVQNQNNQMFAYNYGRPTEDYRDKFQQTLNQALSEHFEILSVTFEGPKTIRSRADEKPGWRVTPYAYVLLKSRGPEVDRLPPIKLDMDFLDTSGYVVIPIESPTLVIDSSDKKGDPRPAKKIEITQILNESRADKGSLVLEISANARGLVPDLEQLIDLKQDQFELVSIDDKGILPTSFDAKTDEIQIVSDRSWTVEYQAEEGATGAKEFTFSDSRVDAKTKFQRYEDVDLVEVGQVVRLEKQYGRGGWKFLYWLVPLVLFGLIGAIAALGYLRKEPVAVEQGVAMPEEVNAFTVLGLLKSIKERNGIADSELPELQSSIEQIERDFFAMAENGDHRPDLDKIARRWVDRVN